jgi:hypothetical protein
MNPPRSEGFVRMPDAEFEAILARAVEERAKRALAALDIRDLRSMLCLLRLAPHGRADGRPRGDHRDPSHVASRRCH